MCVKKKNILRKKKSFNWLRGGNGTPPITLNRFQLNVLLIFLTNHEKYAFKKNQDFLHNNLMILFTNVLGTVKH